MRFGLLGPLVVADAAGGAVDVPGARLRVLVAALLLNADTPVPADVLAEMVWDGAPPPGAARTLRSHIGRLRRLLGTEAGRVETRAPGYLIRVGPARLDVLEFEARCRDAGTALRAGRWDEAADAAAHALELWRGAPLLDIPSQALRDRFVPHLRQLHVQVLEDHAEAHLRLGRHERMLPQLRELAGAHPLRERFHAQLMTALARVGRQAEALAAYRDARGILIDELGIEPGPELRSLHLRILAGESEPPAAVSGGAAATAVPRHLPAAPRHFTGRHAELDRLAATARHAGTVVISAIDGMAGIGKTALAIHAAHRLAERFPDGQLFIDLHGYTQARRPRGAGEALEIFLRALDVPPQRIPADAEERAALYRQRLADTRTLIVLDNAATESQVRPLLPGSAGCLVLVTSRRRLKGLHDAQVLSLDVLPRADALVLLRTVAGPGRAPAEDPAPAEITELCGRLPLALRIAGALLRHRPAWDLEHLAALLRDQGQRIAVLGGGEHGLGAVFELSYRALREQEQLFFRRLGLIPGADTDAHAAAALTGTTPHTASRLLEDLVDQNLLIEHLPGRYRQHDMLRLYARTLGEADPPGDRDAALDRLLDHYGRTADHADALVNRRPRAAPGAPGPVPTPPLPDERAARAWLRAERPNLIAALQHAGPGHVLALTAGLATSLRDDGPWPQALTLHAIAADTAESLGDHLSQANALLELGIVHGLIGDCPEAIDALEQALRLYQRLDHRLGQANTLVELASERGEMDDNQAAVVDLQQALRLYAGLDNRLGQANALTRLGDIRRYTGDFPGATRDLEQALRLYRDLRQRNGQANALTRLGDVRRHTGDLPGATRDLKQALQLYREMEHRLGEANALTQLGETRRVTGDAPGATHDLEQALLLYREMDHRLGEANALTWLGRLRLSTGDLPGAAADLTAALAIFRHTGNRGCEAWALNSYAAAISATGDHAHAHDLYREALRLARETRQTDDEALALEGLGECHVRVRDAETGITHLKQALEILHQLGMTGDVDRVQTRLDQLTSS